MEKLVRIEELSINSLDPNKRALIEQAKQARDSSYAPFSEFYVGCSVLHENGHIGLGSNQENASFPSGLCAERVALFYTSSNYPDQKIKTIAISAYSKNFEIKEYISPCGGCRQVMAEYEEKQAQPIRILLHSPNNKVLIANSVEDILPFIFRSPELKKY